MAFRLVFSAAAERDLALIFDHLFDSFCSFGEKPGEAVNHAAERVRSIRGSAHRICIALDRGTKRDDIFSGLHQLTIERALFWHEIDDSEAVVGVLAAFFGGQDHIRRMMLRLLER